MYGALRANSTKPLHRFYICLTLKSASAPEVTMVVLSAAIKIHCSHVGRNQEEAARKGCPPLSRSGPICKRLAQHEPGFRMGRHPRKRYLLNPISLATHQPIQERAPLAVDGRVVRAVIEEGDARIGCLQVALGLRDAGNHGEVELFQEFA